MRIQFIISITFLLYLISCNNDIPFESEKWLITDHVEYPYRNAMVNNLLQNYLYKGANFDNISPFLGEVIELNPNDINPLTKHYEVDILDPDKITYLYVKLNSNGQVEEAKLTK